jgi:flavorubredoxin
MAHMLDELARKRFAADRTVARFGSFGWNGGGMREFDSITATLNWEVMDSIEFCGAASPNDLQKARALGAAYARKVKERIAA